MKKDSKIYIAGHRGLVGSALMDNLISKGYTNLVFKTHEELDLENQKLVFDFFEKEKPEYVFLAAAKVGGIVANNLYRADFIYNNLLIQNNVINASYRFNVKKLLFLGSTCIYPKECPQPIKEDYLLTSPLEYTNEPYAISKIAGIIMCESYNIQYDTNFISVMPTNLYGLNDNFDLEKSHVLPALLRKMHLAKALENNDWTTIRQDLDLLNIENINGKSSEKDILDILKKYGIYFDNCDGNNNVSIEIWGTGEPMREFLWSKDMADACVYIMQKVDFKDTYDGSMNEIKNTHINIGTGKDISILDLALLLKKTIGFKGELNFDTTKPNGTMKKLTSVEKLNNLGWKHSVELDAGIELLYNWYKSR